MTAGWTSSARLQGDALVYRAGSLAWLDGGPVYTDRLPSSSGAGEMFFTYGPLALLLFVPLSILPLSLAFVLLAVLSWVAIYGALVLWCRANDWATRDALLVGLGLALVASLTTPVVDHLQIGQVNAFMCSSRRWISCCLGPRGHAASSWDSRLRSS